MLQRIGAPVKPDLVQRDGLSDVFQAHRPNRKSSSKALNHDRARDGLGAQHLPRSRGLHEARREVDRVSKVVAFVAYGGAPVDGNAHGRELLLGMDLLAQRLG